MNITAEHSLYLKQTYWSYGFIQQIIKLLFQDHLNYYFRSFRIVNELFKRASDPNEAMKVQEYQDVFELWQLFLTQSDKLHSIKKHLSDKFNLAIS